MQSQVLGTFPFFDFVIHAPNSLAEVNGALRDQLKSRVPVRQQKIFETCFYETASGGVLKVKVHWLAGSVACIGDGECRPTPAGTSITVRVRWPYWWLAGVGLFFMAIAAREILEGTLWTAAAWIWFLSVGGVLWGIQSLAGRALLQFMRNSISSAGFQPRPPSPPRQPTAEKRGG